jgi:hypothetical protein
VTPVVPASIARTLMGTSVAGEPPDGRALAEGA